MKKHNELNLLKNYKSACIISHISPDADALSSMIVLRKLLIEKFKMHRVDLYAEYQYLPDQYQSILEDTAINPEINSYDAAIMLDCPNSNRLGIYEYLFLDSKLKIVIDHHVTNKYQGDINIVEETSSNCQIVYKLCQRYKYQLNNKDKGKLYAGLITDTNNLSVGKLDPNTYNMISEIFNDIDVYAIYQHFLSNNTYLNMKLLSKAIENIKFYNDKKILVSYITKRQMCKFNAKNEDLSSIINKLSTIDNNIFTLFIYPKNNYYYVSMRAKPPYDVSLIAQKYGGGGHKGASAFNSTNSLIRIIKTVTQDFQNQINTIPPNDDFKF